MAIADILPRKVHTYTGVGEYEALFKVYDPTTVRVTAVYPDGATSILVYLTDYTVSIPESDPGVTVTVTSSDYDAASNLRIERVLPFVQTTDWYNGSSLDMPLLTRSFDQLVMLLQQMNTQLAAALQATEWRGTWATATQYQVMNIVVYSGSWYVVTVAHTSDVFATDLSEARLQILLDTAQLTAMYNAVDGWHTDVDAWQAQTALDALSCAASALAASDSADDASDFADAAAASAAALNLPVPSSGDEGKALIVADPSTNGYTLGNVLDKLHIIGNAGTSKTLDTVKYDTFTFTYDQSTLNISSTVLAIGRTITLVITGANDCTITWPTGTKWPDGTPPIFSSGTDRVVMQRVSSTVIHAAPAGSAYA